MAFRAFILSESTWVEVFPKGELIFEEKPEQDQMFYRKRLTSELTFCAGDYDLITGFDACEEIEITFTNDLSEQWDGFFTTTMCDWNTDDCEVSVTPEPNDRYRAVLENAGKEYNLLPANLTALIILAEFGAQPTGYDEYVETEVLDADVTLMVQPEYTINDDGYTLYEVKYVPIVELIQKFFFWSPREYRLAQIFKLTVWRRDTVDMPVNNSPEPGQSEWQWDFSANSEINREFDRWYRPYLDGVFVGYVASTNFTATVVEPSEQDVFDSTYTLEETSLTINYPNAKDLFTCIGRTLSYANMDRGYVSQFFSATNPITGNDMSRMFICQASDAKGRAERATIFNHSFKDLMELAKALNVYWDIADNDKLILEHRRYFDNGGSYTVENIGLDLTAHLNPRTGKPYTYRMNKYSFSLPDMPEDETFEFAYAKDVLFDKHTIRHNSSCVKMGEVRPNSFPLLITDIKAMANFAEEDAPNDGIVMLHVERADDFAGYRVVDAEHPVNPALLLPNGELSMRSIVSNFHVDNRPSREGIILSVSDEGDISFQPFYSTVKAKIQQPLVFPYCETIDVTKLVKTALGNGKVQSLRTNWKTKEAELVLEYEWDK